MIASVREYKWSDMVQDFVLVPLDDADNWVIEIARRFVGSGITSEQLGDLLNKEGWTNILTS
jgi:hypothetical protein